MNFIVLDLEFNQPFDFKNGISSELNAKCPFEIIQIGAVKLRNDLEKLDQFNCYIKPQIYQQLHPFVEKITGIHQETLQGQPSFPEAYQQFLNFIDSEDAVLCTWGIDDIKSLFRNILYFNLNPCAITRNYINIQAMASAHLHLENGRAIGLKNAVELLGLPTGEDFHNALSDASYTAKIFKIVKPQKIAWKSFELSDLWKKKEPNKLLNTGALVRHFQASVGRDLTKEEISMLKSAYKLGRNGTFDITAKNYQTKMKKEQKKKENKKRTDS